MDIKNEEENNIGKNHSSNTFTKSNLGDFFLGLIGPLGLVLIFLIVAMLLYFCLLLIPNQISNYIAFIIFALVYSFVFGSFDFGSFSFFLYIGIYMIIFIGLFYKGYKFLAIGFLFSILLISFCMRRLSPLLFLNY